MGLAGQNSRVCSAIFKPGARRTDEPPSSRLRGPLASRAAMKNDDIGRQILSSLPLQILIYFNGWYCVAYFQIEALLFIYKDHHFYYPPDIMAWEASMLSMLAIMEVVRLFLASKGNKTESMRPMLWAILISFPIITGYVWFLRLQTYVMRLEIILAAIGLSFVGLEWILSLGAAGTFMSAFYA